MARLYGHQLYPWGEETFELAIVFGHYRTVIPRLAASISALHTHLAHTVSCLPLHPGPSMSFDPCDPSIPRSAPSSIYFLLNTPGLLG